MKKLENFAKKLYNFLNVYQKQHDKFESMIMDQFLGCLFLNLKIDKSNQILI